MLSPDQRALLDAEGEHYASARMVGEIALAARQWRTNSTDQRLPERDRVNATLVAKVLGVLSEEMAEIAADARAAGVEPNDPAAPATPHLDRLDDLQRAAVKPADAGDPGSVRAIEHWASCAQAELDFTTQNADALSFEIRRWATYLKRRRLV